MASRERKSSVAKKPATSSPLPPKDDAVAPVDTKKIANSSTMAEEPPSLVKNPAVKGISVARKLAPKKRVTKKPSLAINLKPQKKNVKIKPKVIKSILNNPKNAETKRKLLKTCAKQVKPRKPKVPVVVKSEENLPPPVLEPIFPIEDNVDNKQEKKQRAKKPPKIDNFAKKIIKVENDSSVLPLDGEELVVDQSKAKRVYKKKPKAETTETIEDVMNDLSSLIKSSEVKQETDVMSESGKSDSAKSKKVAKKKRKENIENTLGTLSASQRKIIDMLDLNVQKFKKGLPQNKRRHSIEKFPVGALSSDVTNHVFNNLPRCISPRSKTVPKQKTTIDGFNRRSNPYKTRSDSPARILRNGKHRKLKDLELLEGLDTVYKKRRRNCSEFSGSEISTSKFSGYESDSSFSDMSSLHGAEQPEPKDSDSIKTECKENFEMEDVSHNADSVDVKTITTKDNIIDTNSNIYSVVKGAKVNSADKRPIRTDSSSSHDVAISPSLKVPEKSIILDIMKQTFNDTSEWNGSSSNRERAGESQPNSVKLKDSASQATLTTNQPENNVYEFTEVSPTNNGQESETILEIEKAKTDSNAAVEGSTTAQSTDQPGPTIVETPENMAIKENILQALGLQSLKAAEEAKLRVKERNVSKVDNYTGTLKTVIKINRDRKKGRNSMKMSLSKSKNKSESEDIDKLNKDGPSTSWKHSGQSSDTAGAHRKSHYSNRSNMDGSSEHTSDGENGTQEGATKALVIPEKASSFSIHPGRICKDECCYCYGKFGLFDTPCHVGQMKSVDRQHKILEAAEKKITIDSCLCDACFRHVDRRANTPSYINKSYKRGGLVAPGPRENNCHVLGCTKTATNILRRKWIIKMRRNISEVMNIDFDNPGLVSIPICGEHFSLLEHLMVCAMCRRRLAKNHIHYLGPEFVDLNRALNDEGIPLDLSVKPVVCKLCKFFAGIVLKPIQERPEHSASFFADYKKRLLHFNDIIPMDEAAAEEPITVPTKDKLSDKDTKDPARKKRKLVKNPTASTQPSQDSQAEAEKSDQSRVPSTDSTNQSGPESPSDIMVDYNTLIPSIAMECGSDTDSRKETATKAPVVTTKKSTRPENVKQAVEISKITKLRNDTSSDIAVQRLGSNPSISVRQLFPCEEDLPLQGHIEFGNVKERTPEGWEKCTSVIQYDMDTKHLWHELQKPYGNQSSFLRHLILLEKYFRNGDLVLSPSASHHSINYAESVQNRLKAYDNIPSTANNVQPLSMLPFNRPQKSQSGIITSTNVNGKDTQATLTPIVNAANIPKSTPITISQLNSPPLIPPAPAPPKLKPVGAPPGLISLMPGTSRPASAVVKQPQSQKIKFPLTKNWRPNLIPIDVNKKTPEKTAGLVQVISCGKPYHISLEDYKKMCAIKKSYEINQKRFQNANNPKQVKLSCTSVLKPYDSKKSLVISKTAATSAATIISDQSEKALDKLEKQVEKLEPKLTENRTSMTLPKIPKSLTVIPQTVSHKPSRPSSPVLLITPKPKQNINKTS